MKNEGRTSVFFVLLLTTTLSFAFELGELEWKDTTPPRPVIPSNLTASINYVTQGQAVLVVNGMFYLNDPLESYVIEGGSFEFPGVVLETQLITVGDEGVQILNNVCRVLKSVHYENPFSWVEYAHYAGQVTVNETLLDVWQLHYQNDLISMAVLSTDSSRIVYTIFNFTFGTDSNLLLSYEFPIEGIWEPNQVPPIQIPQRCFTDGVVCPKGTIENMLMIRFHQPHDYEAANRNFADAQGDCSFICNTVKNGVHTRNQIISQYEIQVNSSWGRYALCNFNYCYGGNNYTVGHEAAYSIAKYGGQCSTNPNYGNWYSLTAGAQCVGDQNIGENNCAWKFISIVKSISLECLENVGFLNACELDNFNFPFTNAANSLNLAFNNTDPASGGCPALPPYYYTPPSSSVSSPNIESFDDSFDDHHPLFFNSYFSLSNFYSKK